MKGELELGLPRRDERRKRQAWVRSRAWSRGTRGVVLSVMGAVQ